MAADGEGSRDGQERTLPLSSDSEWADFQPALQPEGPVPVVAIQYGADVREGLAYLRELMRRGERSARALALTEQVVLANSANYSAWEWRWECLLALGPAAVAGEVAFMARVLAENPKNYQLWNHRRRFALYRGAAHAQEELDFAAQCLTVDAKNYHAWSHRTAVVREFGQWAAELAYVDALLEDDVRNNSAWNQRFFVISQAPDLGTPEESYDRELAYVGERIRACPHNDSAWAYLRGLFQLPGMAGRLALDARVPELCCQVLSAMPSCGQALAMMADVYTAQAAAAGKQRQQETAQTAAHRAAACYRELLVVDPLRAPHWRHCQSLLAPLA